MAKKKKKNIVVIPNGCLSDGEHFYRVENGRILHVVNDVKSPLINILYDLRKTGLYVVSEESFNCVLNDAIVNLGLLSEVRNVKINQVFN